MPRQKPLPPHASVLLHRMATLVFENPRVNPWNTIDQELRSGKKGSHFWHLRQSLKPLRGIGRQMQRYVLATRSRRPWPENIKWAYRRRALLRERLPECFGADGQPSRKLPVDARIALGMLAWYVGLDTGTERRELSRCNDRK